MWECNGCFSSWLLKLASSRMNSAKPSGGAATAAYSSAAALQSSHSNLQQLGGGYPPRLPHDALPRFAGEGAKAEGFFLRDAGEVSSASYSRARDVGASG